jgi:hypothetical protein
VILSMQICLWYTSAGLSLDSLRERAQSDNLARPAFSGIGEDSSPRHRRVHMPVELVWLGGVVVVVVGVLIAVMLTRRKSTDLPHLR